MNILNLFDREVFPDGTRKIDYPLDFFDEEITLEKFDEGFDFVTVKLSIPLKEVKEKAEELVDYVINDEKTRKATSLDEAYKKLNIKDGDSVVMYKNALFKNPSNYLVMPTTKTKCGLAALGQRFCIKLSKSAIAKFNQRAA